MLQVEDHRRVCMCATIRREPGPHWILEYQLLANPNNHQGSPPHPQLGSLAL